MCDFIVIINTMQLVNEYSNEIIDDANDFLAANTAMFKANREKNCNTYVPVPVALKPSPFPKSTYSDIRAYQKPVNALIETLMKDISKVHDLLEPIAKEDSFIASLIDISRKVQEQKDIKQTGYLGIMRTDYMVNNQNVPKLVELNTIASGLCAVSDQMRPFYEYMIEKHSESDSQLDIENLPTDSHNTENIIDAMKAAHDLFLKINTVTDKKPVVAFLIDEGEVNISDQKLLENTLFSKYKVIARRLTFEDVSNHVEITEKGELIYKEKEVITMIYYRSGYCPTQYPTKKHWKAREMLELSTAVKAPSVDLQLLTFKKIQEALSSTLVWDNLIGSSDLDEIKPLFEGQMWGFDHIDEEVQKVAADAIEHPENYVLKTQREGGGNNYFGDDIKKILQAAEKSNQLVLSKDESMNNNSFDTDPESPKICSQV